MPSAGVVRSAVGMGPQGGSGECPPWRGWASVEDTSHPHSTRAPGLNVCRHPQPRSLLVGIRFQAQDPPHTWESHGAWGGCGSAGLDMAESLRGDTCPLTLGRSSWRAPGARWTRGPREGSPVPQTCRADPGTGRADPRAWGAGAAGRDGAPGGRARVGSPPAVPQHQDPPWGRRDPLPGSRPQRRGQAARPRTPGAVAPVPGPRCWQATSQHTLCCHTRSRPGRRFTRAGSTPREEQEDGRPRPSPGPPGQERETPRQQGSLRAPEDRGSSPPSTQAVGNASSLDIRTTSVLWWPHQDPLATPQERRPGDSRGP